MHARKFARWTPAAGVAGVMLALSANLSHAETMNVTATVLEVCELGTITDTAFGNLTPGSGATVEQEGTIQWRCSNGTNADITIDQGGNGDRTMDGPNGDTIAYELYKDPNRSEVWGGAAPAALNRDGEGMTSFLTETVYGQILPEAYIDAEQGAYSDTVTVLIQIN